MHSFKLNNFDIYYKDINEKINIKNIYKNIWFHYYTGLIVQNRIIQFDTKII